MYNYMFPCMSFRKLHYKLTRKYHYKHLCSHQHRYSTLIPLHSKSLEHWP